MLILLTNDDGIHAPGISAMYRELATLGEVHVIWRRIGTHEIFRGP